MTEKPRRLGRGLEALLGAATAPPAVPREPDDAAPDTREQLRTLRIDRIRANPFQPRREFAAAELASLANSLRESGLLQPITVRALDDESFELVAGERRLRAATQLGWTDIPALVRDYDDRTMLTLALVENLQRADLNPLEEAEGYLRLAREFNATHQQIAEAVGKDRSTVANALRLLELPATIRRMLESAQITAGHARALLSLSEERPMIELAREIIASGLSVRETERRARKAPSKRQSSTATRRTAPTSTNPQIRLLTDALRRRLQTDIRLDSDNASRGELRIAFYSADDLNRIIELVLGRPLQDV
ncbi:MAG TPA: ParB/RepB/Spo0J family partition protein [Gemmatimonadaceae bacterium]|nr:ParB/RepB/Spo0J family partition protein [Gemmatimonadaceae bacterium]